MLSLSVRNGHLPVVQYLIERGQCYAMCTNTVGQTPLHYASGYVYMLLKQALVNSISVVCTCVIVCVYVVLNVWCTSTKIYGPLS